MPMTISGMIQSSMILKYGPAAGLAPEVTRELNKLEATRERFAGGGNGLGAWDDRGALLRGGF